MSANFTSAARPTRPRRFAAALLFAALALLSACTPYGKVTERRVSYRPAPPGVNMLVAAQESISNAFWRLRKNPHAALGEYVTALQVASTRLAKAPGDATALHDYNFALSRVFSVIRRARLDPWTRPLTLPGGMQLTYTPDPRPDWNAALYEFVPADEIECGGTYITRRQTQDGLGAPLIAIRKEKRQDYREAFVASPYLFYGVTAVARFQGARCIITIADPLATDTITVVGHRFPLAADYTVALAMMLARERPEKLEIARLFFPEKYAETARIARLEPYDPRKTPVLIVHGLMSSPATWVPMVNTLRADPVLRHNFQFWYFSYPSGYPIPYSAALLRHELDAIDKAYPQHKRMILVGHSMGGVLSRLLLSDSGDALWLANFGKPPAQVHLSPSTEAFLHDSLFFRHRPDISRAIFIAAPHRGSDLALSWFARFGSWLVRAPKLLVTVAQETRDLLTWDTRLLRLSGAPNSLDTLAPNNRFVLAAGRLPMAKGVPYHSIIGDRGRRDTPNSSDGVVPYWSSHLAGAASELIVPANHQAHQSPQGIEEVRRILHQAATR